MLEQIFYTANPSPLSRRVQLPGVHNIATIHNNCDCLCDVCPYFLSKTDFI